MSSTKGKFGLDGRCDLGGLLLDTGSTFSGVRNSSKLVSNVRSCTDDEVLTASTNGGTVVYNKIGDLNFLPLKVYVNDNSLVDVLSMKDVLQITDLYVMMDSRRENAIFESEYSDSKRFMMGYIFLMAKLIVL